MIPILLLLFFGTPLRVDAYIDPGAGSYLFQVLIASGFGALFTIRSWLRRRKAIRDVRDTKKEENERQ